MDTGFSIGHKKALNLPDKADMKNKQKNKLACIALLGFVSFTLINSPALAQPDHRTAISPADASALKPILKKSTAFRKSSQVSWAGKKPTRLTVMSLRAGPHRETVKVVFDPSRVSYQKLLSAFWRMHDPSDATGSFVDRGRQYGSAIYYVDAEQRRLAEGGAKALDASGKFDTPIATSIEPASGFYVAEACHQDYHLKSPLKYKYYRYRSGRDQFIEAVWVGDDTVYQSAQ